MITRPTLSISEHSAISRFIQEHIGIEMPLNKRILLESRLAKRLSALNLDSYGTYFKLLKTQALHEEFALFTDLVTTHETRFFREPSHFQYLMDSIHEFVRIHGLQDLRVLCAACSTGQEAYTLSMCLAEACLPVPFCVEGFDISALSIRYAQTGIYEPRQIESVPMPWLRRFFLRSRKGRPEQYKISPELAHYNQFHTGNLLKKDFCTARQYDIVFCRNLLIYFDQPTQRLAIENLINKTRPGGLIFLGHSETMSCCRTRVRQLSHGVFQTPWR